MKTTQFTLTIGVNPGFGHNNQTAQDVLAPIWQREAANAFQEKNIYVGATVVHGMTVYHTDWGCPVGGERTAVVSGLRNPQFTPDDEAWKETVRAVSKAVGKEFGQKNLYLTFQEVDFEYIVESEKVLE